MRTRVSDFFYYEITSKIRKTLFFSFFFFFFWGGVGWGWGGGARVIFFTKNPNLKKLFRGEGGGMTRVIN